MKNYEIQKYQITQKINEIKILEPFTLRFKIENFEIAKIEVNTQKMQREFFTYPEQLQYLKNNAIETQNPQNQSLEKSKAKINANKARTSKNYIRKRTFS